MNRSVRVRGRPERKRNDLFHGEAVDVLREVLGEGDVVLVKGSRLVGLEAVAAALTDEETPA